MGTGEWTEEEADDNLEKGKVEAEERTGSCPEEAEEGIRSMWRWGVMTMIMRRRRTSRRRMAMTRRKGKKTRRQT